TSTITETSHNSRGSAPALPTPKTLNEPDVNEDKPPELPVLLAVHAGDEELVHFKGVPAVPGKEQLGDVAVGDDEAGGEHDLGGIVQVPEGDHVVQVVEAADGDGQHQHHGESGIDGPGDEVRR